MRFYELEFLLKTDPERVSKTKSRLSSSLICNKLRNNVVLKIESVSTQLESKKKDPSKFVGGFDKEKEMSENGDLRQDGTFLPLPLPRQFSHEGRRGSLGKFFFRKITFLERFVFLWGK